LTVFDGDRDEPKDSRNGTNERTHERLVACEDGVKAPVDGSLWCFEGGGGERRGETKPRGGGRKVTNAMA